MDDNKLQSLLDRLKYYGCSDEIFEQLEMFGETAIPGLIKVFDSKEWASRLNAAKIFEKIGDARVVPSLLSGLDDPDETNRNASLKALLKIESRLQNAEIRSNIIEKLAHYLPERDNELLIGNSSRYDDSRFNFTKQIISIFGELKDVQSIPYLVKILLGDHHPWLKEEAAKSLAQIGDESAALYLMELVKNQDYIVHFALDAIGKIGSKTVVPELIEILSKTLDDELQASIMWTLGQIGDPQALPILFDMARNHTKEIRAIGIETMGLIRDGSAVPMLVSFLTDDTLLYRQDPGGTHWLFRTYRNKRISEITKEALQRIGTSEALFAIERG